MKKSYAVIAAFVLLIAVSFAFTSLEDPNYTNLKILPKNISKTKMDSVMKSFTAALGVKCNFCHTYDQEAKAMNFASDANEHKDVARQMMRLTTKLNKKFFDVKNAKSLDSKLAVTCQTCHNGKEHPATLAPKPTRDGK